MRCNSSTLPEAVKSKFFGNYIATVLINGKAIPKGPSQKTC
tara:strand:- start:1329 stop:1451 length:123 start_codon:yes stop_codon:yes gene_type:complete